MFQVQQKITTLSGQELFLVYSKFDGKFIICESVNMIDKRHANIIRNPRHEGQLDYIMKLWGQNSGKLELV